MTTLKASTAKTIAAIRLLKGLSNSTDLDAANEPVKHPEVIQELLKGALTKHSRDYWTILEGLVVFDEILYDAYAFQKSSAASELVLRLAVLSGLGLTPTSWPKQVYETTASAVRQFKNNTDQSVLNEGAEIIKSFDSGEKRYHDDLAKNDSLQLYSFAESNDTFERALFYAELGRNLGLHLLPRAPGKSTFLEMLSGIYKKPHQLIQGTIQEYDIQMRPAEAIISAPPLAQKIAWTSITTGRSRLDVVSEMRESVNAKEYRRHIADLQGELNSDTVSNEAVGKLKREFEKIVEIWSETGNRGEGVKYKTHNIRVQVLPIITALSEAVIRGCQPARRQTH